MKITKDILYTKLEQLNALVGKEAFKIYSCYGAYTLLFAENDNQVFNCGYIPAKDLYNRMEAFYKGITSVHYVGCGEYKMNVN